MKKTILFIAVLLLTISTFSQQGINYKAVISDNGNVLQNQSVFVRFTILENGTSTVYEENHTATTDASGIIIVNIGEGTATSGDFTTIDWSQEQFLKVEINTGSGYANFGTTAFKAVPYAKYAENGGGAKEINDLTDAKTNEFSLFLGEYSGANDNGSNFNVGVGYFALKDNTSGEKNTVIGYSAGSRITTGSYNSLLGTTAGLHITTGDYNSFFGYQAGANNTGYSNLFIGYQSGYNNITGDYNLFFGHQVGFNNTGYSNLFIGGLSGYNNVSGHHNIFLGHMAGYNETGSNKLYIENTASSTPLIGGDFATDEVTINGSLAIKDGTEGTGKILISDANGKASWQTPIDQGATEINELTDAKVSSNSVFLGEGSGIVSTSSYNVGVGISSLNSVTVGYANIAVGYRALLTNVSGDYNVALGHNAGNLATGNRNIFLGYNAGYYETGDHKLYIDNTDTANPLIGGDFSTNEVTINGELEVTEKITAPDSGAADMKAYIYGSINSDGTKVATACSDGFTVSRLELGKFEIIFDNSIEWERYVVLATIVDYYSGIINVRKYDNVFQIHTRSVSYNLNDRAFDFIVYKK